MFELAAVKTLLEMRWLHITAYNALASHQCNKYAETSISGELWILIVAESEHKICQLRIGELLGQGL